MRALVSLTSCVVVACLQGEYFVVDNSSFLVEEPERDAPRVLEIGSHFALTPTQLSTLAHALRSASLAAPGAVEVVGDTLRLLPVAAFVEVVSRLALAGKLAPLWSAIPTAALHNIAAKFCRDSGLVDWQAFCAAVSVSGVSGEAASGAQLGSSIRAWPSHEDVNAFREKFEKLEGGHGGNMRAAVCETVKLWADPPAEVPPVLESLRAAAGSFEAALAGVMSGATAGAQGWHNVAVDYPTRHAWQSAEAARIAVTNSALSTSTYLEVGHTCFLCACARFVLTSCCSRPSLQDAEAVYAQSVASVDAASAAVRRTLSRAFSDPSTSCVNHRRLCNYYDPSSSLAVPRDVYEQLAASMDVGSTVPGLDG